jgi:hypothetical protein
MKVRKSPSEAAGGDWIAELLPRKTLGFPLRCAQPGGPRGLASPRLFVFSAIAELVQPGSGVSGTSRVRARLLEARSDALL